MPTYEVKFKLVMPGQTRETEYAVGVVADNPTLAIQNGIEEWKRATEPRDVRVKEVTEKQA
jgi:hypothetical protein